MQQLTPLRVGFVPGVMPGKWQRIWAERTLQPLELVRTEVADQLAGLRDGTFDMCLARGEAGREFDKDEFHVIALYRELPVVVAGADHPVAAYEEIELADLAGEHDVLAENPGLEIRLAVETVAAGTGIVMLPMSLARLHHRKDVVAVPVRGAADHPVGLVWPKQAPAGLTGAAREEREAAVQMFIGVVRGRTANSSR